MAPPSRSTLTSRAADSIKGAGEFLLSPTYVSLAQSKDALRSAVQGLEWVVTNCGESKSAYPTRPDIREAIIVGGDLVYTELRVLKQINDTLLAIEHPEHVSEQLPKTLLAIAARIRQITFVPPHRPRSGVL